MNTLLAKLSALLDSVPQLPGGAWVNHFAYGGALGLMIAVVTHSWIIATAVIAALCAVKKVSDYLVKHETIGMCVGKTVVTALLPLSFLLASYLK